MLTFDRLVQMLNYDPETGIFTRAVATGRWGRHAAGSQVGRVRNQFHLAHDIDRETYYLHRLAFLYMTGKWPSEKVDHINGDGLDNRWSNLRDVEQRVNLENLHAARRSNLSGLLGVSVHRDHFDAVITVKGKRLRLGRFGSPIEAHAAYVAAKRRLHDGCTL